MSENSLSRRESLFAVSGAVLSIVFAAWERPQFFCDEMRVALRPPRKST